MQPTSQQPRFGAVITWYDTWI